MRVERVTIPLDERYAPAEVKARMFDWAPGLAITPSIVPVLKLSPWRWEYKLANYTITHLPSMKAIFEFISTPAEAYRQLSMLTAEGIDWTQDYQGRMRSLTQEQKCRFDAIQRKYRGRE